MDSDFASYPVLYQVGEVTTFPFPRSVSPRLFLALRHEEAMMGGRLSMDSLYFALVALAAGACKVPSIKELGLSI